MTTPMQRNRSPIATAAVITTQLGLSAAAGALAGHAFRIINPIGGAVFGVTYAAIHALGRASARNEVPAEDTAARTAIYAVSYIVAIGAGVLAAYIAGFSLSVMGAISLSFGMILTSIPVEVFAGCFFGPELEVHDQSRRGVRV